MAICVAPLTTTVMNAVAPSNMGVASGINNALSRIASLLTIAILGIVMLNQFSYSLNQRISLLQLAPEAQQFLESQRVNLAAATLPPGLDPEVAAALKVAIATAFVDGFRAITGIAAGLAIASSVSAALLIEHRRKTSS